MSFSVKYAEAVQAKDAEMTSASYGPSPKYSVTVGKRYDKVVHDYGHGGMSVHAFVERATGDVYKAEGWSRPAKGVRGNVATEENLAALMARFDPYGGYLYAR